MWSGIVRCVASSPALPAPAPQQRRYLALWTPFLQDERRRQPNLSANPSPARDDPSRAPRVFVENARGAMRIVAASRAAHACGLTPGLTLADARARAGDVEALPHDPKGDERALDLLAAWCERFTPLVALDAPLGLMLDITGCGHLFGGEEALRDTLGAALRRFGLSARAAIAPTPDLARALARFGGGAIAQDGAAAHALPVAALEAGEHTHLALQRAGLKTIGDLAERPSHILTARFGADTTRKLARLLCCEDTRITPRRPLPECMVERHFPEPFLHQQAIEAVVAPLMTQAADILERRGQGGRLFSLSFFRSDGVVRVVRIETAAPLRATENFMRLFRLKAEKLADPLDPGFGFDAIRLSVIAVETMPEAEQRLDGGVDAQTDMTAAIDRLVARLGRERVLSFIARDTHDPDRASGLAPYEKRAGAWPAHEEGDAPARPLRMIEPPLPVDVVALAPDGPPAQFRWRRALHIVARAEGPERVAPEWWRNADAPTRDYYRVEDAQGRRFWLFREGLYERDSMQPRWMLHGLFA
ncbi:MAG: DNA polymerase Y family protein [Hyphomicrobiales bacterium]|nr:DNA polymerase Y family protein [Hyphomicrobiales bacterium]